MLKKLLLSFFASVRAFLVAGLATVKEAWTIANVAVAVYGKTGAFGAVHRGMLGAINTTNAVEVLIYIFIAITILYQLIPNVSNANQTVQSSSNVSAMGKFGAGLGEWLFPLLGIIALIFLLYRRRGYGKASDG